MDKNTLLRAKELDFMVSRLENAQSALKENEVHNAISELRGTTFYKRIKEVLWEMVEKELELTKQKLESL